MCARLEVKLFTRVRISLSRASKEEERGKKLENEIGETRIFLFSFFLDSIILLTPLFVLDMGGKFATNGAYRVIPRTPFSRC